MLEPEERLPDAQSLALFNFMEAKNYLNECQMKIGFLCSYILILLK
jgi:hypothetical protein